MRAALTLLGFRLRRERVTLPLWILGCVGLLFGAGGAVAAEFGDVAERTGLIALAVANPAFLFLRGVPDGTSVGALVFFQTFSFLAVLVALMNTFLVVRHTRADEERGRAELVLAAPVPRWLDLAITLKVAAGANVLVAIGCIAAGLALDFGAAASVVLGLAVGGVGLAFAGIAALVAQAMPSPRGANGVAAALVGIAYLTRGVGDALGTPQGLDRVDPSWISWLSPIGWGQATRPFSEANPWPLLALLGLAVLTGGAALVVRARRDLDSSLIPERRGATGWRYASATALAARLQRGTLIGWTIGTVLLGGIAGALGPVVAEAIADNDQLADLIARLSPGAATDTAEVFVMGLLGIAGVLATAAGVQALSRLRVDEAEGRTELLLSTRLTRAGLLGRHLGVAVVTMLIVSLAAGLAAGVGTAATFGEPHRLGDALAMTAVQWPAGAIFLGLTALLFGFAPRATIPLGWGLLVLGLVLGQFGDLLGLASWARDLSPFAHIPAVPVEDADPVAMTIMLAVAFAFAAAGFVTLRRRDIPA